MPRLNLSLLGPPRVEVDGKPITVDTRKAIALLAYLALTGQSQSRERLAALFWPNADQARAHGALRRTLSALNKALGGVGLKIDRESVALEQGTSVWLDVGEFRSRLAECLTHGHPANQICPACLQPLADAAALYRDDFLAGFTLRDSPGFDDWQFFQAESLRQELAGALERLAHLRAERREFEPAIASARRWLALDPLHEPAHRHLMRLYAWSGQRAAALRQYQECVRVLDRELGVAPLEETTALHDLIKENRALPPMPVEPAAGTAVPSGVRLAAGEGTAPHLPLVGRATEWEVLVERYSAIRADGHLLILEGEAGVGKTRLAEELLQHARRLGAMVAAGRCYEGETKLAYGPVVEAVRATLDSSTAGERPARQQLPAHWLAEAARLWPDLSSTLTEASPPASLDNPGAQARFLEGVSQFLLALLAGPPAGVIFFDDLHWADEATLDLLTFVVRRLAGRPLCVLVTWRSEYVPADHRLRHLLAEGQRSGTATQLSLPRLSRSDVEALVRLRLPQSAAGPERLAERLHRESEGLPFFVAEYLAALADRAGERADWSLPAGVQGLLRSRLAGVSETGRQLLSAAAVIGRSFDFEILHRTSGRSDEETVRGLEALVAHGLVREMEGGASAPSYDFNHDKLRMLAYEETSAARRTLLHRRVAEALTSRPYARDHPHAAALAARIAEHYRLGGREAEAAEYYKRAGEHAMSLWANAEAVGHLRQALALGHPDAPALHEALGDVHTLLGDYAAALASYEAATADGPPALRAKLEHKQGNVHHRRGEWEAAERHYQAALAAGEHAPPAPAALARLHADWSLTTHRRDQGEQAQRLARGALEFAQTAGDRRALAQAYNVLGVLASSQGNLSEARHHLEHSLALAEVLEDHGARTAALNNLALALGKGGEAEQALDLVERALALCMAQGDRHREAALHNNLADLLHTAGRPEEAMAHLKQAVAIFAEIGADAGEWQPEIWKLTEW